MPPFLYKYVLVTILYDVYVQLCASPLCTLWTRVARGVCQGALVGHNFVSDLISDGAVHKRAVHCKL